MEQDQQVDPLRRKIALIGVLLLGTGILGLAGSALWFFATIHWALAIGIIGGMFAVLGVMALVVADGS